MVKLIIKGLVSVIECIKTPPLANHCQRMVSGLYYFPIEVSELKDGGTTSLEAWSACHLSLLVASLHTLFDIFHGFPNCCDRLSVLVRDLSTEFVLKRHDQFH